MTGDELWHRFKGALPVSVGRLVDWESGILALVLRAFAEAVAGASADREDRIRRLEAAVFGDGK